MTPKQIESYKRWFDKTVRKCKTLAAQCPDAEVIKAEPSELLQFARLVGIQGMPFVVVAGEPQELANILNEHKFAKMN